MSKSRTKHYYLDENENYDDYKIRQRHKERRKNKKIKNKLRSKNYDFQQFNDEDDNGGY